MLNETLNLFTTIITVKYPEQNILQGSAFFYNKYSYGKNLLKKLEKTWLITNRHLVLSDGDNIPISYKPLSFTFNIYNTASGMIKYEEITLNEISNLAIFHQDSHVDICIIDILDIVRSKIQNEQYIPWGIEYENLVDANNTLLEVGSNVLVIGYPKGFYDNTNLYPIVKSGSVASKWNAHFNGNPYFLVDAKLLPGSSGSLVISQPTNILIDNNNLVFSKEKKFHFLGIFSGEIKFFDKKVNFDNLSIQSSSSYNLAIVWYGKLIEDIIKNGVSYRNSHLAKLLVKNSHNEPEGFEFELF